MTKPCAEVIASTIRSWSAQCWDRHVVPSYGALVVARAAQVRVFGIVHEIEVGVVDGARIPFAYQKTEAELLREQPQIFNFMKTVVRCTTVGYEHGGVVRQHLAPIPPALHTFVGLASPQEQRAFFADSQFIALLAAGQLSDTDELIVAVIERAYESRVIDQLFLSQVAAHYSALNGHDYHKLRALVVRLGLVARISEGVSS